MQCKVIFFRYRDMNLQKGVTFNVNKIAIGVQFSLGYIYTVLCIENDFQ